MQSTLVGLSALYFFVPGAEGPLSGRCRPASAVPPAIWEGPDLGKADIVAAWVYANSGV